MPGPLDHKPELRRRLRRWYSRHARVLSWRNADDPYVIWLSEIMLQQTRVEQGTPYIERFLEAFPTVRHLARASEDRVLKLWEGLGYYSRARNLHKAAKVIMDDLGGEFPRTAEDWRQLPGVGPYTAAAIASIAFDEQIPVVDGNVKRVIARLIDLSKPIDSNEALTRVRDTMTALITRHNPGDFNQAVMELGAQVCIPRNPRCPACPVREFCQARRKSNQHLRPVKIPKKKIPHHRIVVAAIRKNGRYLLGQRPPSGMLGGLWEFPGGKIESGETPEQALAREIAEELNIGIDVGDEIATVNHAYSHFKITLTVFQCTHTSGSPQPNAHTKLKWVRPRDFHQLAFPKANHKFLHLLE